MASDTNQTPDVEAATAGHPTIGERFRVLVDTPLPALDRPGAAAFVARDLKSPERDLYALACSPDLLPRVGAMVQTRALRDASIQVPLDWGAVEVPGHRRETLAVIFERPDSGLLVPSMTDRFQPMTADQIRKRILTPIVATLLLMTRRGITHRAIRPDNLFGSLDGQSAVLLGECVTSPPGWAQPAYMEAIEMAMTPPTARGAGGMEHDMYALGATVLFLAIGRCPVTEMDENELLRAKIENGSFLALLNGERSPLGLREPLRGLLADDPVDRWGPYDVEEWLGGTLSRAVRPVRMVRAERAFAFKGNDYRNPRLLADALGRQWSDAAKAVRSIAFRNWIGLSVPDMRGHVAGVASDEDDRVGMEVAPRDLTRICMQLDPYGPLRYRGLIVNPDSLGGVLAEAFAAQRQDVIDVAADLIQQGIAEPWFDRTLMHYRGDFTLVSRIFQRLHQMLRHGGPAQGIERALYELSPFAPCLSKSLGTAYVYSLHDLLPKLEALVAKKGRLPELVDRHLAAFIAARIKANVERPMMVVGENDKESVEAKLGMVAMLAAVQTNHGPETVPALTEWLAGELEPAVAQFQSRTLRANVRRRLEAVASSGRLGELHDHLNNPELLKRDQVARYRAVREFSEATAKIDELESNAYEVEVRLTSWRIATGAANTIAVAAIVFMILW